MASLHIIATLCLQTILLTPSYAQSATPYAVTNVGIIQGKENDGAPLLGLNTSLLCYSFKGIPFAKPPVGQLRWKRPEPNGNFDTVYEAFDSKAACPQVLEGYPTSEDCLYLDIYLPHNVTGLFFDLAQAQAASGNAQQQQGDQLLPVMIWVHGGGYSTGYAAQYPAFKPALEQNMIVVVIQYRLNYLGFLASGDDMLKGNFGLWDQRLAMLWVKDNIRAFGGDSSTITVAGESAGAASVSQHAISRQSSGIFQKVVMMSGAAGCPWAFNQNSRHSFKEFANLTGCGGFEATHDTVDCMRNKSVDVLAQVVIDGSYFVPVVDGEFFTDTVENLLKDHAYLDSIGYYNYSFLNGVLNNEGAVMYGILLSAFPDLGLRVPDRIVDTYVMGLAVDLYLGLTGPDVRDAVDFHYFYPRDPVSKTVPVERVLEIFSDTYFVVPAVNFAGHYSKVAATASSVPTAAVSSTTYMYLFDWYPDLSAGTVFAGMFHALDVFYLFGLTDLAKYVYSNAIILNGTFQPVDHALSSHFGNIIGAFVRTGDPNNGIPDDLKGRWLPYDVANETYLVISPTPSVGEHMYAKRVSLWNDLVSRLQARFLQETEAAKTTSPVPTTAPPTQEGEEQRFSNFSLTEDEANSLITALIVICSILAFLCVVTVIVALVFWKRNEARKYSM